MPMTEETARQIAHDWLLAMQSHVRAVDYHGARALFRDDVVGFGTYSGVLTGLDQLLTGQWRHVWGTIRDFTFRVAELHAGGDGDLLWVACPWDSQGTHPDSSGTFNRPGRVTVVLTRDDNRWLAAHTHFSLYPPTAGRQG